MNKEKKRKPLLARKERRSHIRFPRATLVHLSSLEEWDIPIELSIIRSLNVSVEGLRLELNAHYPIPCDSTLEVDLGLGDDILRVKGCVVYAEELEDGHSAVGIRFKDIDAEAQSRIQAFLERPSARRASAAT